MSYTITYNESGYFILVGEGNATLKELREAIISGSPLVKERNCFRVLSDFRNLKLGLSVIDIFSIPALQAALSKEFDTPLRLFRRAVLIPEADYEKYKFFENVAVNRSHIVKIFIDEERAVSWLLQK